MISVEHLTKSFGQRTVFQDLSLQFTEGKVYALIGNSGCGKTTLLNILAKIEPYEEGSISYQGQELKQIKQHNFFKRELGYLFQNFGLLENETIAKNLDLVLVRGSAVGGNCRRLFAAGQFLLCRGYGGFYVDDFRWRYPARHL